MQFSEFYINKDGFVLNVTFQKIILSLVSRNFQFFHFFNNFLLNCGTSMTWYPWFIPCHNP